MNGVDRTVGIPQWNVFGITSCTRGGGGGGAAKDVANEACRGSVRAEPPLRTHLARRILPEPTLPPAPHTSAPASHTSFPPSHTCVQVYRKLESVSAADADAAERELEVLVGAKEMPYVQLVRRLIVCEEQWAQQGKK